ncbi:MAG: DUF1571 domain-containing protein [Pirellulales bacterium]|nr:DUF1571 domain-containing protein [Pirellulales bacterium]
MSVVQTANYRYLHRPGLRKSGCALAVLGLCLTAAAATAQVPDDLAEQAEAQPAWPRPRPTAVSIATAPSPDILRAHPIFPLLETAHKAAEQSQWNCDYTCTLVIRERIAGQLSDFQYAELKVRQAPRSFYLRMLSPDDRAPELLFVTGRNEDMLWARCGRWPRLPDTTISLALDSPLLRQGHLRPLTELTMADLLSRSIRQLESDAHFGECEARIYHGAKVDGQSCTCLQVTHPVPRRNFTYHLSRLYLDDASSLAVRFEGYTWPELPGGDPVLSEEYTFTRIKLNASLGERDFDPQNPAYGFDRP